MVSAIWTEPFLVVAEGQNLELIMRESDTPGVVPPIVLLAVGSVAHDAVAAHDRAPTEASLDHFGGV